MANIRSAYAEVMACALTGSSEEDAAKNGVARTGDDGAWVYTKHVDAVQKQTGWLNAPEKIGGVEDITANDLTGWNIVYTEGGANATITEGAAK